MFPTASTLHVAGVIALDLSALAVLACFAVLARRERRLFALAALVIVAIGVAGHDLAITAVVDLAVLVAVGGPAITAPPRTRRL